MHRIIPIALVVCAFLAVAAIGPNPAPHEEMQTGGGRADPIDGGADFEKDGTISTTSTVTADDGFISPHISAPGAPANGHFWTQTTGFFVRINGVTVGPVVAATAFDTESELEAILTDVTDVYTDNDTVPVVNGGSGATTLTDGGALYGSGTGAITALGVAANGQIPIGDGATDPVLNEIDGTASRLSVTNGAGTITLDIDAAYVGQTSIVTLGTIATGVWDAGAVTTSGALTVSGAGDSSFVGNVGIGTLSPGTILQVEKTGSTTLGAEQFIELANFQADIGIRQEIGFGFERGSALTYSAVVLGHISTSNAGNGKGSFYIATRNATTDSAPTVRLFIEDAGNVGINDTSPSYRLDVNGTGRFVNDLTLDSDLVFSSSTISIGVGAPTTINIGDSEAVVDIPGTFTAGTYTGQTSIVTLGAVTTGSWTATVVAEAYLPDASTTAQGVIEIATGAETNTGTDATRAVSPDALEDWTGSAQITTLGTIAGNLTVNGATNTFGDASTDVFTFDGRMLVRSVTDAGPMTATGGTQREIVYNTSDSKFYGCTVTHASAATWVAFN